MTIERINTYHDERFSDKVLKQHGAFLVDEKPYEVEIISDTEAVVRGEEQFQKEVIEEFRFYAEHICSFYNKEGKCIAQYPAVELFDISIEDIQPSQFFADRDKKDAVLTFIQGEKDIVIPLNKLGDKYVSVDGHTRLFAAIEKGYHTVKGFLTEESEYIPGFVKEAQKRGVFSPYDITELSHEEYEVKWNQFCEEYFARKEF